MSDALWTTAFIWAIVILLVALATIVPAVEAGDTTVVGILLGGAILMSFVVAATGSQAGAW